MNVRLLSRLKTRDSALIYEFLFERLNRSAGSFENVSFEWLAHELNAAGLTTSRSSAFTAAVVRNRLNELERLDVVSRKDAFGPSFTLYVFMPYPAPVEAEPEPRAEQIADPYGGRTPLFDGLDENASESVKPRRVRRCETVGERVADPNKNAIEVETANERKSAPEPDARPSVGELREKINFENPKVARFRSEVVKRAWEPGINPDLLDRVVGIAVLSVGGANYKECYNMIDDAKKAVERYERTDGKAGRQKLWQSLAWSVKRHYETAGWRWVPTRIGYEPKPEPDQRLLALIGDEKE